MTVYTEFDVVIPVHKKDLSILEYTISHAKKNIAGVRRVIIVSKEKYSNNAEWCDESLFPFSFQDISDFTKGSRAGWYFQQFLKLYAPLVIPNISENVLILDSDTVFFKKVKMFDKKGRPFFNISKDKNLDRNSFDIKVVNHIKSLFPAIAKENMPSSLSNVSGVSHHMVFNCHVITELFKKIEDYHFEKTGIKKSFYQIAMGYCVDQVKMELSEYQIYFNYMMIFHYDEVVLRKLHYKNTSDSNISRYRFHPKYHYCSFHHYLRGTKTESLGIRLIKAIKTKFKKLFLIEKWNIGIAKCNISEFLTIPNQEIKWLKPFCKFRADPFGFIDNNGEKQIFFEHYSYIKRKGEIRKIALNNDLKITSENIVLENQCHFSYPYIFQDEDQRYAAVESYKSNGLDLYRVDKNNNFIKVKRILDDLKIADPSIVKFNNKWWLFFSLADRCNGELYIAHSDNLLGGWQMHKNNPVKIDIESARSGGEIFWHKNSLYRPAQNCSVTYGGSLIINKIKELSVENFIEEVEIQVTPNQLGRYPSGLHHISKLGENFTLIDGKKYYFAPHKPLLSFLNWIHRLCRCAKSGPKQNSSC
jgi:hypothetical protein